MRVGAILLEAVDDARAKEHFNTETAINDLWVKLSRVRTAQNQQAAQMLRQLTEVLKAQQGMMKGIMQNMR